MYKRQTLIPSASKVREVLGPTDITIVFATANCNFSSFPNCCLLYTSDAADEEDSVDLGGRRIIKKKKKKKNKRTCRKKTKKIKTKEKVHNKQENI